MRGGLPEVPRRLQRDEAVTVSGARRGPLLLAKHKVDRPAYAQGCPEVVQPQGLLHVEHRERRDHLMQGFELAEIHRGAADPVGRHLQ